jgi:hypothetical protein
MTKFLVHVVLHDADSSACYPKLDAQMHQRGFRRELPGKKATYLLPEGSYWYEGRTALNDLRTRVAAVAEQMGQNFGILVVKLDGWSVMRLEKVGAASQG